MILTQELHVIRAHQLHYSSLLEDFRKTVEFVSTTRSPAMDSYPKEIREHSAELMRRECTNLLNEIRRLEMGRKMQDKRLKNVMNLVGVSLQLCGVEFS
jgi:CRISPR/Cas system-associated endonuclease Cas1